MQLNDAGWMIKRWYSELANTYPDIPCDAFVFIVVNVGADLCIRRQRVPPHSNPDERVGADLRVRPPRVRPPRVHPLRVRPHPNQGEHIGSPLQGVMPWFKTMTIHESIRGVKQNRWPPFPGKLWQRNYWEHIVRNESELHRIRVYIQNNPAQWETDRLYRHDMPNPKA
jgi:putative transposase